jgi:hypothetical protein
LRRRRVLDPMSRTNPIRMLLLCGVSLLLVAIVSPSADARTKKRRIGNFSEPVYLTGAPGYRKLVFVVERRGTVRVMKRGHKLRHPFLDIRSLVDTGFLEQGLLSIAFPPDYKRSKRFYVFFTDNQGDLRIEEYRRRSATRARRGSRRLLLEIRHRTNDNHDGGQLQFLGQLLYISTGDGGSGGDPPNNAQNKDSLLGKILRIDPRNPPGPAAYSVPAENPFVGRAGRDEVFSYGLRNPYRFSFRHGHGGPFMVIGDVGQDRFEEIDYERVGAAGGANFGWDAFEGFAPYTGDESGTPDPGGTTKPALVYGTHSDGNCTIVGGYVVRSALGGLRGRYLYSDFCAGNLRSFRPGTPGSDHAVGIHVDSVTSFGEDTRGRVYVCSQGGPVYRLVRG